jgi:hypothetical protein
LLRAAGAAGLAGAAALALTSCSLFGVAPTSAATPSSEPTDILDPSIPIETPTASPAPTATPTATVVPTASPKPSANPTTAPAAKRQARPFIMSADWDRGSAVLDVQALVPKTVESDGRCTLTARRGTTTVTATSTAAPGAQDTQCNPMDIPASRLTSGTWTVTVTYLSSRSAGTSAPRSVTVAK